ncbi:MAG: hypothetical protein U1F76_30525 [Candidatus Competibacteraceae bacterium]
MRRSIFKAGKKYTFSDYFEFGHPTEEIIGELGYSLSLKAFDFPVSKEVDKGVIEKLRASYYELLPKISINSEAAKREFMIAPVLHELLRQVDAKLNVEYPIDIDDRLSGSIDYLLRSRQDLVVVEAKKGDLDRGFNQLAAEMIAVDKYEDIDSADFLYGAITIGEVWRFAALNRKEKVLTKGIHTFRSPEDLEEIFAILKGILGQ